MDKEIKEEIVCALNLLKASLVKNNMSIGFNKETNELLFFGTLQYVEEHKFKGFKINLDELVR